MIAGASSSDVTGFLLAWSQGDRAAFDRLALLVERGLKLLAYRYLRRERAGHTLQIRQWRANAVLRRELEATGGKR